METKSCIRKRVLAIRNQMPEKDRMENSRMIAGKLCSLKEYKEAEVLLGFVGYGSEVDTIPFLEQAVLDGKKVYCPVSDADGTMEFYRFSSGEKLIKGYKNILEPSRSDEMFQKKDEKNGAKIFLLMPGVAFDKMCHRIGYGKGFYDRYLADFSPQFTVAVCFACQVVETIPTETHDFIPDMVVTEKQDII